jgi:hypothetical protein
LPRRSHVVDERRDVDAVDHAGWELATGAKGERR